ncbi:ETS homologous factor-like isoform X2 [Ornithodoros turicata]|uniref:ETS homologous factor-like isoform X2 n=1 Tax=Ornithodoros turicata TaxID=34597 RepID=UPI003138F05E
MATVHQGLINGQHQQLEQQRQLVMQQQLVHQQQVQQMQQASVTVTQTQVVPAVQNGIQQYQMNPYAGYNGYRVQSRTPTTGYRMMVNQTPDLMTPHESPYNADEHFMYEPTDDDKNAYCNLQPIGLDNTSHVTQSLSHSIDLMPSTRPIPFEGDTFPSDVLDLEADRWQSIPIQHWQPCDVLNWLVSWSGQNLIELVDEEINIAAFSNMSGEQLCRLSLDEFRAIAPPYGHRLYEEVQRHLGGRPNTTALSESYYDPEKYGSFQRFFDPLEIQNSSPGSENESDSGSTSSSLSTVNERTENLFAYMPQDTRILSKQMPPPMPMMGKKKGRRGRPPMKEAKVRSRAGKGMGKLWEFIRDLLLNPTTNPSLIRWERREDGIFKFVQSDKVAKMWGDRKQNPRMTYEKLSRAMRTYYGKQILEPVPKLDGLPKKLVYKFGPRSSGWSTPASDRRTSSQLHHSIIPTS